MSRNSHGPRGADTDLFRTVEDLTDESWSYVWQLNPGIDDDSFLRLLADAKDDPNPEFRIKPDPRNPERLVPSVHALMEVHRALGDPDSRRIEFDLKDENLKGVLVESEVDPTKCQSLDLLTEESDCRKVEVTRHKGRVTKVKVREHRPLK